jgi:Tfp pilus assembly protein PilO|tara:strand:- start:377609 stop:378178 length:570 start_codon:yes stop_codon:yes gene_type:complete
MMSRLLPFIFVLIAGAIFMGYIHPTITGSIAETNTEIQSYDSALKAAARFEAKQAELAAARAALPPDGIARLEGFLPDGVDNVQLIFDLDALASRTGVKLSEFTTSESNKPATGFAVDQASENSAYESSSPYDSLDLSMSATGSYAAFRAFLTGAETSLRPLDLVELSLNDSSTGVYTYDMTFRLYWLR